MVLNSKNRVNQYSDIDLSFKLNPMTGDIAKKLDENAINQSIHNLITFKIFDVPFHPEINGSVRQLLFENMSPVIVTTAQEMVYSVLNSYEPRINVLNVDVSPNDNYDALLISVRYEIINSGEETSYKFYVYNAR